MVTVLVGLCMALLTRAPAHTRQKLSQNSFSQILKDTSPYPSALHPHARARTQEHTHARTRMHTKDLSLSLSSSLPPSPSPSPSPSLSLSLSLSFSLSPIVLHLTRSLARGAPDSCVRTSPSHASGAMHARREGVEDDGGRVRACVRALANVRARARSRARVHTRACARAPARMRA